jgi:hypothetical protein
LPGRGGIERTGAEQAGDQFRHPVDLLDTRLIEPLIEEVIAVGGIAFRLPVKRP